MKQLPLFFLLFLVYSIDAIAGRVTGLIKDEKGQILPFASIMIKGTSRGTTANNEGRYFLNLDSGKHIIVCQYVGYSREEKAIISGSEPMELDFTLKLQSYSMDSVVVTPGGPDPAYAIIREAIKKRPYYLNQLDAFQSRASRRHRPGVGRARPSGDEVHASPGAIETRQAPVVVDCPIADRAHRQLRGRARWLAVWQAAAAAERAARPLGRGPALEADGRDHAANRPVRPASRTAMPDARSAPSRWISQDSGVETPAGRRSTRAPAGRIGAVEEERERRLDPGGRVRRLDAVTEGSSGGRAAAGRPRRARRR